MKKYKNWVERLIAEVERLIAEEEMAENIALAVIVIGAPLIILILSYGAKVVLEWTR